MCDAVSEQASAILDRFEGESSEHGRRALIEKFVVCRFVDIECASAVVSRHFGQCIASRFIAGGFIGIVLIVGFIGVVLIVG